MKMNEGLVVLSAEEHFELGRTGFLPSVDSLLYVPDDRVYLPDDIFNDVQVTDARLAAASFFGCGGPWRDGETVVRTPTSPRSPTYSVFTAKKGDASRFKPGVYEEFALMCCITE